MKDYKLIAQNSGGIINLNLINWATEGVIIKNINFGSYDGKLSVSIVLKNPRDVRDKEKQQEYLVKQRRLTSESKAIDKDVYVESGENYSINLSGQRDMSVILALLKIVQEIDPIPYKAMREIMEASSKFDLSSLFTSVFQPFIDEGDHAKALQLALEADQNGDVNALPSLAYLYQNKGDDNNYYNVLDNFPPTHKSYVEANKTLHDHLQMIDPAKLPLDEKINLLERKLAYSLKANIPEATNYFDQLCGNSGLNPELKNIKGDSETLIALARKFREMKKQNDDLKKIVGESKEVKSESQQVGKLF